VPNYETGQVLLLHQTLQQPIAENVRFVHAALGSPPPTTFFCAVERGYINGPRQFPRLTTKVVRRYMPNSEATARGHLRKSPTAQPYAQSEAVSALCRHHKAAILQEAWRLRTASKLSKLDPKFDPTMVPKSTTLHFDYTGALPERCSSGTLYFMVSCWGSYIHLEPLHSLKGADTAQALEDTIDFYRSKGVRLDGIRLDNQSSPELRAAAAKRAIIRYLVSSNQKEANRSERAIQTAKSHVIATRAGFHRD
jgi:hypothetical protein